MDHEFARFVLLAAWGGSHAFEVIEASMTHPLVATREFLEKSHRRTEECFMTACRREPRNRITENEPGRKA
jgi:hypothetical protein